MNTTTGKTSPIDSITSGTKNPEPTTLTQPMEFPEKNLKAHVPGYPEPEPSLSDSSPKKNKRDKKKKRHKKKKDDLSDPSSSNNSDSSYDSDYRRKIHKRKIDQKKDPIKLCTRLTAKLLTTVHKSNIIRFKWMRIRSSAKFIFSNL